MIKFIDVLKEEVLSHEEFMISENQKSLKPLSKTKLKGENNYSYSNENLNFFEEISKEILSFDVKENFILLKEETSFKEQKKNINKIEEKDTKSKRLDEISLNNIELNEENKDKNLNIDFITSFEIDDNKFIGFNNIGNSCYLNSGLQILIHLKNFVNYLFNIKDFHNKQLTYSLILLIDQIKNIISISKSDYSNLSISPSDFKSKFENKHSLFNNNDQQDCSEFLRVLLEDISKENNRIKGNYIYEELEKKKQN